MEIDDEIDDTQVAEPPGNTHSSGIDPGDGGNDARVAVPPGQGAVDGTSAPQEIANTHGIDGGDGGVADGVSADIDALSSLISSIKTRVARLDQGSK